MRWLARVVGMTLAACYVLGVTALALLKAAGVPAFVGIPWAEVVYGPGITVISCSLLILAGAGIGHLVEARKVRGRPRPRG
jgi:hypothetical protein